MSDGSRGVQQQNKDEASKIIIVVIGVGLVLVGLTLLGRQLFWPFLSFNRVWGIIRGAGFGLGLVIVGIITIIWTQRRGFKMPAKGMRLYRSRTDRVVAGVLAGVAAYLDADPTLVRLAYVGLGLMFGVWPAIVAYVIAVLIVPEAPVGAAVAQQPPAPPSPPPPPPPAAPPSAPPPAPAAVPSAAEIPPPAEAPAPAAPAPAAPVPAEIPPSAVPEMPPPPPAPPAAPAPPAGPADSE